MTPRREYGEGSLFQRHLPTCPDPNLDTGERPKHNCPGRWVGSIEAGYTATGARRRVTVTAKTEAAAKRKLRDKKAALDRHETASSRATVKSWADQYLAVRVHELSPKGYNAAASPIRKWIIPTIGHKRLDALTPGDIRAVQDAQHKAGRQSADTHRVLRTMLRAAADEGYRVPPQVLSVKARKSEVSDRRAMTVEQGLACIEEASKMPNGIRWVFTLFYGQRMGECLGLTWGAIDFDAGPHGEAIIEWQLQPLPYNVPRDRSSGFRVPDGYDAQHLVDSYHLVRPKSRAGYRVAPLLKPVRDGLLAWRELAPESPHDLVWPESNGRPRNDKHDRAEWHALQERAGVSHPSGRPFHVHETRHYAATMLLESGVAEHVITDLLGHSALATSLKYRTRRREPLQEAMELVGQRHALLGTKEGAP